MNKLESVQNKYTDPLLQAGYELRRGWDEDIAAELMELSKQQHIQNHTPNDTLKRFKDLEMANAWYAKNDRTVYTIANTAIAGLIWFGASQSEYIDGDYTFAIRVYEEAQGKRLARPFMNAAHEDFRRHAAYNGDIWLSTDINNERAIELYEKVGYKTRQIIDGRLVMTSSAQD